MTRFASTFGIQSRHFIPLVLAALNGLFQGCLHDSVQEEPALEDRVLIPAGGSTTHFEASSAAFSSPLPGLGGERLDRHRSGDAAFEANFVAAPAPVRGGLGPYFNQTSCRACHNADGRGRPPKPGEDFTALLLRASLPGDQATNSPLPVPGFGGQLQPRAVQSLTPEVDISLSLRDSIVTYSDGIQVTLRIPAYTVTGRLQAFPGEALVSPRIAPPVFGLGLLEAVPEAEILALADPEDANGDGISGRPNWVYDVVSKQKVLGRFGWKANTPNLLQQSGAAYVNDMGIRNHLFNQEGCETPLPNCDDDSLEVTEATLAEVTFYVQTLAVPGRRNTESPVIKRGEALFHSMKCAACHQPILHTNRNAELMELAQQIFAPYTDLLLHDMGPALADHRPDFEATGNEWRTAPLWGIGLTEVVNGHTRFLHDGRAESLETAILWHGGEAEASRKEFQNLNQDNREAVLKFLGSL